MVQVNFGLEHLVQNILLKVESSVLKDVEAIFFDTIQNINNKQSSAKDMLLQRKQNSKSYY